MVVLCFLAQGFEFRSCNARVRRESKALSFERAAAFKIHLEDSAALYPRPFAISHDCGEIAAAQAAVKGSKRQILVPPVSHRPPSTIHLAFSRHLHGVKSGYVNMCARVAVYGCLLLVVWLHT
jgi:hypothetical protein